MTTNSQEIQTIESRREAFFAILDARQAARKQRAKDLIEDQVRAARSLASRLNSYAARLETLKPGDYLPSNEADSGLVQTINRGDAEIRDLSAIVAAEDERIAELKELLFQNY